MDSHKELMNYIKRWSQMTYREGLEYCYEAKKDENLLDLTIEILDIQNLSEKKMDGNSIEKIPCIEEGKVDIIFSDIFHEIVDKYITPVYYITKIVKECLKNNIYSKTMVAGIVGRGLRAFPAFIRELDLKLKVLPLFPNAKSMTNPLQDVKEHTDILLEDGEKEYRFWSYQDSKWGLKNTAERLLGKRGELPGGLHVMCPIDVFATGADSENIHGWTLYSKEYINNIEDIVRHSNADDYIMIKRMDIYSAQDYLRKLHFFYKK